MRNSWAQPSLSRDFALLSAAIFFILCIISAWFTFSTYSSHAERTVAELDRESMRIERTLGTELDDASFMLAALGKQIVLDPDRNLVKLAQTLKSFDNKEYIYSILSWVTPEQMLAVSSNKGVLEKPVDISDREYIKKALQDPWKMVIGNPVEGRVSGRWVIPVAMGITDYTGQFIGTIMISLDINMLTERIKHLLGRDGISFAIVSKAFTTITEVADDKDFVNNNFPIDKISINLTKSNSGLLSHDHSPFGNSTYAFYRVSEQYPYIVLLGYDVRLSNEGVRGLVWFRIIEMIAVAVFFVLFLWIVRIRMIRSVLEMASIAAGVAKGEVCASLSTKGGPVEIEGLAAQIRRVSEYIEENKRIEDELRNKMFMLKKAKERAEIDRRSQSEFMAYVCQEMRTPLNNIIGGAQVMKDQLYGPLENRKYRQYASDIYAISNVLMDSTQDLLTLAKAETDYVALIEKPLEVAAVINKALRFLSDKMQSEKLGVKVQLKEPMPRIVADEFRLQQILMNLLLYALDHSQPEATILLESRIIGESRDKLFYAFVISSSGESGYNNAELIALAEQLAQTTSYRTSSKIIDITKEQSDVSIELAKMLLALHGATIDIRHTSKHSITISVFFGINRIRFDETQDK